ncbi:unnamed protein product [Calicophoron daubneyi]|uniref:Gamma-tubulin complex component n=1 Tax=Calicophoron daubneyi TaxID=300641 RepID=A0AAV2TN64_CALDB
MNGTEPSSSGFYSDVTKGPVDLDRRSTSDTPYSSRLSSILNATRPIVTDLWGQPPPPSNGQRGWNGSVKPHMSSRSSSKSSTAHKARSLPRASEADLLRELMFVLNGVSGSLTKFDPLNDCFKLSPSVSASPGQRDSVRRIAECGWLHDKIRQFIADAQKDRCGGAVAQSLASGLHENLTEYYRLIATLESQLGREDRDIHQRPSGDENSQNSVADQPLTLTRLTLWTREPRFRLRFLASLCDACRGKKGGALASVVYLYTHHGDPEVANMMQYLLKSVASTLLHLIGLWIYDGQLEDPYQEFFVALNPSVKKERLWHEKYSLRRQMIPDFITPSQASKILLAGKAINFLQYACGEKRNIKDREAIRACRLKRVESMFEQDLDSSFEQMISTVYLETGRYLLETLIERYHFLDHLRATRQFLLLGQGDFIQHLMDLLDADLSKPASQLLTHRLGSILETAIRDTNAQYEQPEILQRLDVRLLDISADDTGWDVFSLDYYVDGPLATIFTDDCRLMYLRAFNFLWRAKRMEFVLSNLWKHQFIASRLGHGLQADLEPVLHLSELLGAEIRHCVQQLQYYVNFEVLECAWEILVKQIRAAADLDEVIEAHQAFLSSVITRCLLDASSRPLIGQLRTIFDLILNFAQLHYELDAVAETELATRERYSQDMAGETRRGKWGTDTAREFQEKARRAQFVLRTIGPFQARVRILASSYREMVISFIRMLCEHPDPSLRYLAEHLNFNGHYFHQGSLSLGALSAGTEKVNRSARTSKQSTASSQEPNNSMRTAKTGDMRTGNRI